MRITKRQLRRIVHESIMNIKIMKPNNPWMHDHYEVDGNLAQEIADELADACEGFDYSNSYAYDRHVNPVLQKYLAQIDDMGQQRATVRAVQLKLEKMSDYRDFHQGANAARKSVQTFSAYQTPGFSKAKRVADHGYDPVTETKLTGRQLKQIIREEYSRLKRRGLIRENKDQVLEMINYLETGDDLGMILDFSYLKEFVLNGDKEGALEEIGYMYEGTETAGHDDLLRELERLISQM